MWSYVIYFVTIISCVQVEGLWDTEALCPLVCTCQLQHSKETAIHRFMQKQKENDPLSETDYHENNEVLYEDDFENDSSENNPVLRSATCILQTDTNPLTLIESLPQSTEALTLIRAVESGNKSLNFTFLQKLPHLLILELHGSNINERNEGTFFCTIDTALPDLKYLNLDRISIKVSKEFVIKHNSAHVETTKIKHKKMTSNLHPTTLAQHNIDKDILQYNSYHQREKKKNSEFVAGFESLLLLRISNCELKNIEWEMFDSLHNLEYLILEKNNLKVIPDFAFYGLPNLKSLSLAWNNLLDMQITDLAGLLELEHLDLSYNNFSLLSELSFPPFPNLKLANFANNPINVIFPSTFEIMNTTDSLILGGEDIPLTLLPNSFSGLKMLKKLTLKNLVLPILKREFLVGMFNLSELIMSGNISRIEFDAFVDVLKLQKLIVSKCNLQNISMDAFSELKKLQVLDLSQNNLKYLHPGTFDPLKTLKELYINKNHITHLPYNIFSQIHPKLIRLNDNPWHCSCKMSDWKPMIINKVKQKIIKHCDFAYDRDCDYDITFEIKYVFHSKVAPICNSPNKFKNWNVFHVMRKQLKCSNYKPKYKKKQIVLQQNNTYKNDIQVKTKIKKNYDNFFILAEKQNVKLYSPKIKKLQQTIKTQPETKYNYEIKSVEKQDVPIKISLFSSNENNNDNDLNQLHVNHFAPSYLKTRPNEYTKNIYKTSPDHQRKNKKHRKLFTKNT